MQHFSQKTCRDQPVVYSILYCKMTVLSINMTNSLPNYREQNLGYLSTGWTRKTESMEQGAFFF
jgi:hypothetical protein